MKIEVRYTVTLFKTQTIEVSDDMARAIDRWEDNDEIEKVDEFIWENLEEPIDGVVNDDFEYDVWREV